MCVIGQPKTRILATLALSRVPCWLSLAQSINVLAAYANAATQLCRHAHPAHSSSQELDVFKSCAMLAMIIIHIQHVGTQN